MAVTKHEFAEYIKSFRFKELFNEMGWNNDRSVVPIIIDDIAFTLTAAAEKSGFRIFTCPTPNGASFPGSALRKKIEGKLTKLFHEHLVIFYDRQKTKQVWQLAVRKAGSPVKVMETRYSISQDPELLYQRAGGLFFTLDEEEKVTIIDVTKRVAENFRQNSERVTKKFYEGFKKEHTAFLKFIEGIEDRLSKEWYASLMLNRLMFCYFIQKKGFLDNNKNYLREKLTACKQKKGENSFYSFYRDFLLSLFHNGLGAPNHSRQLQVEIGKIPYLNGGLFDVHEIEKSFSAISIEDRAFENLFTFFDDYEWHLDTRDTADGRDINPDVIGYIFEKYINDRAQMGAYYTKEDITEYIGKNCIIPWLFDDVKRRYPKAFAPEGAMWHCLKTSGDAYIYDAVKHGVPSAGGLFADLPDEVRAGFAPDMEKKIVDGEGPYLYELRKEWNKPAPPEIALPTEIYREVIERRKRCADVMANIANGGLTEINDFITYNLNIRQFVQDVIETTDDPAFIRHFYRALSGITILDPTCGSGAFLFAALNILEPLYEACINRMQDFIDEEGSKKHTFFKETLESVNAPEHPNLQYFIYKTIILKNLYGVDIMKEAVEIAKLRLFLKLTAAVDADYNKPNLGLEPLPDVDFNIRAGNTLIGFATEKQLDDAFSGTLDFGNESGKIKEKCDIVARAFTRYKEIQLKGDEGFEDSKSAKDDLHLRLQKLRNELDTLLHKQHYENLDFTHWHASHQPFHWFAEFYEIINGSGGFDVVIGNPPYLERTQINYTIHDYITLSSNAVHSFVIERSLVLLNNNSNISMILPLSIVSTQRMVGVQQLLEKSHSVWYSNYSWRPGKLFDTVNRALTIFCACSTTEKKVFSTNYKKWCSEIRDTLMHLLAFSEVKIKRQSFWVPKLSAIIEQGILEKVLNYNRIDQKITKYGSPIYYRTTGGLYWKVFTNFPPYFKEDGKFGHSSRETHFFVKNEEMSKYFCAILSADIFWYWYTVTSNLRDLNPSDILSFAVPESVFNDRALLKLSGEYLQDIIENSKKLVRVQKNKGATETQSFIISKSKPIIDQIDCLLAQHYGFTHEELDFIINYDIKYRMGKELSSGEEESDE